MAVLLIKKQEKKGHFVCAETENHPDTNDKRRHGFG
jgi:hypothetical protein